MFDIARAKVLYLEGKYEEAARMFLEGAEEGDAEGAFNYAYCLMNGKGVARDAAKAKSFYTFASNIIGEAAYNLAVMHLDGIGTKRDPVRALEYMNDAAEMGIIEAQLYLGVAYAAGSLYEPDIRSISLIPYHTPEHLSKGHYLDGDTMPTEADEEARIKAIREDANTAFLHFRDAARHPEDYVEELAGMGKFLYARCFLDGLGTEPSRQRGDALMLVAAKEGSPEAQYYIETEAPYLLESIDNFEIINTIRRVERLPGAKDEF